MTAIVFVGPTLRVEEVGTQIDARCRPPAAQGDVYRVALERPCCIGIIDGYFDGVPSVWHKEILWAMAQGIPVFGSASMGALRAAELWTFGMRGVGRIFEDYRDGVLEDDDEVAVLHAPAELGFAPLSEPMVSIRATVAKAVEAGVLAPGEGEALVRTAKDLHYRDRSWERILDRAGCGGLRCPKALRAWLPAGRVDAKREDAVAMLKAMASELASGQPAPPVDYSFEWTNVWDGLAERIRAEAIPADGDAWLVLDELRLDRERFDALGRHAALRRLALDEARRRGLEVGRRDLLETVSEHRKRHGLTRRRDLAAWLEENGIGERQYELLARESAEAHVGAEAPPDALARHILAELMWSGEFAALRRRALDKAEALGAALEVRPAAGPGRLGIVVWYFERRLGEPVPDDLDAYARGVGLASREELYRVLEREYLYFRLRQERGGGDGSG